MQNINFIKVGNTPIIKLSNSVCRNNVNIYVKLEYYNPTGSIKDRLAYGIIEHAINNNKIDKRTTFLDATTGNFGVSLAFFSFRMGYKSHIIMPKSVDYQIVDKIKRLNGNISFVSDKSGIEGAVEIANSLLPEIKYGFCCNQYKNLLNVKIHKQTTGLEIASSIPSLKAFVSISGSGGTLTGVSQCLKERNKDTKAFCVYYNSTKKAIGNFFGIHRRTQNTPSLLDASFIDGEITVSYEEVLKTQRMIAQTEGLLISIEGAANIAGALQIAKKFRKGDSIVTIIPNQY